jgi:catechol 1,2-dioxygenase
VRSVDATPLPDAVIDIWQTGPQGATTSGTSASRVQLPRALEGRVDDGAYEFETMLPKPYTVPTEGPVGRYLEAVGQHPWRPAHIHFKVDAPGHEPLVTQVFFPDDPYLENDTIGAVKPALVRPVEPEGDHLVCPFDIVLRPAA